jgi:hypothetical protein
VAISRYFCCKALYLLHHHQMMRESLGLDGETGMAKRSNFIDDLIKASAKDKAKGKTHSDRVMIEMGLRIKLAFAICYALQATPSRRLRRPRRCGL